MTLLHLEQALLDGRIVSDVAVLVEGGVVVSATPGVARKRGAVRVKGLTLPGMPNLHSHAFQRGMAGLGERRGASDDSFWTWREVMYRFLDRLNPDDLAALAAQAYAEMLEGGFTGVCEFHYLHHDIDGRPYGDLAAMAGAIAQAAHETGIGLTLLPVFYRHGGFGGQAPGHGQRRFICDPEVFQRVVAESSKVLAGLDDAVLGIAPHSLRAVGRADLDLAASLAGTGPIHLHIAEQEKEVADCLAWSGQRPVEWLLGQVPVDARWCLIHATHLTPAERDGIAASGAVAGLCPVTEANLGDGIFDGVAFAEAGGCYGVGTDSNVQIGVAAELRQFEYSQRLRDRRRARLAPVDGSVGMALYRSALAGGARASGRAVGAIAAGCRADLVTIDTDHPALVGRSGEALLDSAIFAARELPVREVRVGGRLMVERGHHVHAVAIRQRFASVMRRVLA
ncbi:MAG: formimidoylglutamate deiminase [Beijerinckiaceae bacterium]|jgi:formiminoglutamate deiminase|nr:formimidoylglutamate deiminase [Beijerinckiaceae bacterium]